SIVPERHALRLRPTLDSKPPGLAVFGEFAGGSVLAARQGQDQQLIRSVLGRVDAIFLGKVCLAGADANHLWSRRVDVPPLFALGVAATADRPVAVQTEPGHPALC